MEAGREIALRIDQILLHDATGPLCALELAAMSVGAVRVPLAVAYTDHLLLEAGHRNADDHVPLETAARRFGMWYSRAGNGISHAVHQQRFGRPGASLLGADSHTPAAGAPGLGALRLELERAGRLGVSSEAMVPIGQIVGTVEPTRCFDRHFRSTSASIHHGDFVDRFGWAGWIA